MRKGGYQLNVSRVTSSHFPLPFPALPFPCPSPSLPLPQPGSKADRVGG